MKTILLNVFKCLILLVLLDSCKYKGDPKYDFNNFASDTVELPLNLKDSIGKFISAVILNDTTSFGYSLFPKITGIDVSSHLKINDEGISLDVVGDEIIPFTTSSYLLLGVGFFLDQKYKLKYTSYDEILRSSVILDTTNYYGIYLLSKLRYEAGEYDQAKFLIEYLVKANKNNAHLKELAGSIRVNKELFYNKLHLFLSIDPFVNEKIPTQVK